MALLPLTSCSTGQSVPNTLPRQHSRACPGDVGVGKPTRGQESGRNSCPLLLTRVNLPSQGSAGGSHLDLEDEGKLGADQPINHPDPELTDL